MRRRGAAVLTTAPITIAQVEGRTLGGCTWRCVIHVHFKHCTFNAITMLRSQALQ